MAKLPRYLQKLFGSSASANQISTFGSLAAGSPARYSGATINPDLVQALSTYLSGWNSAQIGAGNPAIEDMNALFYLVNYQLAYLMQEGVAEWNSATTYFIGSVVNSSGTLYVSLTDNNLNNAVTSGTNWVAQSFIRKSSAVGTSVGVGQVAISGSSGGFTTTSGSYVDITNLSVTLVTSGRPVMVGLIPAPGVLASGYLQVSIGNNTNADALLRLLRNGSDIMDTEMSSLISPQPSSNHTLDLPPSCVQYIDAVAAGTYTYKMQAAVSLNTTFAASFLSLFAYEL